MTTCPEDCNQFNFAGVCEHVYTEPVESDVWEERFDAKCRELGLHLGYNQQTKLELLKLFLGSERSQLLQTEREKLSRLANDSVEDIKESYQRGRQDVLETAIREVEKFTKLPPESTRQTGIEEVEGAEAERVPYNRCIEDILFLLTALQDKKDI